MRALALTLAAATLGGCAPRAVQRDHMSACRVARSALRAPLSAADLVEISAEFPRAHHYAKRAYDSRIAGIVLTSFGAAGLIAGFATGFAVDTSQPAARTAVYSLVGGTIGLGAGALLAGMLAVRYRTRAYTELDDVTRAECP